MQNKVILLDYDDTLVDFKSAERFAFFRLCELFQVDGNDEELGRFMTINQQHWEAFQQAKLSKEEVLSQRFEVYFDQRGIDVDGKDADEVFRAGLAIAPPQFRKADIVTTLKQLAEQNELYIVTNGVGVTQRDRIVRTPFKDIVNDMFVSEDTGYQKPLPQFFDYIFERIGNDKRERSVIVGDSLTSDILGGENANLTTYWFNPNELENHTDIKPDYTITTLKQLL